MKSNALLVIAIVVLLGFALVTILKVERYTPIIPTPELGEVVIGMPGWTSCRCPEKTPLSLQEVNRLSEESGMDCRRFWELGLRKD